MTVRCKSYTERDNHHKRADLLISQCFAIVHSIGYQVSLLVTCESPLTYKNKRGQNAQAIHYKKQQIKTHER